MNDHEMICFEGKLIPVLGTVGGTDEEARETARNIERFLKQQSELANNTTRSAARGPVTLTKKAKRK